MFNFMTLLIFDTFVEEEIEDDLIDELNQIILEVELLKEEISLINEKFNLLDKKLDELT